MSAGRTKKSVLNRLLKQPEVRSQRHLAAQLGVLQQNVNSWFRTQSVPPKYCRPIEFLTEGKITRYELRPDIFGTGPDD